MDYELMMNGNVKIGMKAPDFEAQTTMGNISLVSIMLTLGSNNSATFF